MFVTVKFSDLHNSIISPLVHSTLPDDMYMGSREDREEIK